MKIYFVDDEQIEFDNGDVITFGHCQECCEVNYADFKQIDDIARSTNFESPIEFEPVEKAGFRFGNKPNKMFFVPCYSNQNGFYSSDIEIYYNNDCVLNFLCEEHYFY